MDIKIKAVRFEASEKLEDFVVKKLSRLERFSGDIGSVEVTMKVVKPETAMNKEVTIKMAMPGKELYVQEVCDTFEEAVDKNLDSLKIQLSKYKEKQKNH